MRVFPRLQLPKGRKLVRRWRQVKRHLSVARITLAVELVVIFTAVLMFGISSNRATLIGSYRRHPDLLLLVAALSFFGLWHIIAARRLVRMIERRFAPAEYDERRILFDLGQEARSATDLDALYASIVHKIREALQAVNIAIFVRDPSTGDFHCRVQTTAFNRADTSQPEQRPNLTLSRDAFVITRLRHLSSPLSIDESELDTWERALSSAPVALRTARARERGVLREVRSALLLPIKINEQVIGVLSIGERRGKHKYTLRDKEMLMSVAGELAFVIENARLIERIVSEEQLRRELQLAAEVQQGFLPADPPVSDKYELAGFCQPARGVGGDYYDFLSLGSGNLGLAIADVAGKGIAAALVMANFQAALRSQTMVRNGAHKNDSQLIDIVSTINSLLYRSTSSSSYVTFFYAQLDTDTRKLTYINAGHNPPLLLYGKNRNVIGVAGAGRAAVKSYGKAIDLDLSAHASHLPLTLAEALPDADARAEREKSDWLALRTGGLVVGLFDGCKYEQETIQLEDDDLLVAYTDGVTEAMSPDGEEFGEDRLQRIISASAHLAANQVCDQIVSEIKDWCREAPQHDDLTFMVMKVK